MMYISYLSGTVSEIYARYDSLPPGRREDICTVPVATRSKPSRQKAAAGDDVIGKQPESRQQTRQPVGSMLGDLARSGGETYGTTDRYIYSHGTRTCTVPL
jgi:hypothetical protein